MATAEQAEKIRAAFIGGGKKWPIDGVERATLVIEFCRENGIRCLPNAKQLAAGMGEMPYWAQGPREYLDFVTAITASWTPP